MSGVRGRLPGSPDDSLLAVLPSCRLAVSCSLPPGHPATLSPSYDGGVAVRVQRRRLPAFRPIHADARVLGARLKAGESATYMLGKGRRAYLVPATGRIDVNGTVIEARDGAAIRDEEALRVTALEDTEIVLVDVD